MPRKPNYGFERRERDRLKAEKKAERDKQKTERREANRAAGLPLSEGEGSGDTPDPVDESKEADPKTS
jgi:hypothetical protein